MTESQLLLLNNLVYRWEFVDARHEGLSIGRIFGNGVSNSAQLEMTSDEWDDIYEMAKGDPEILDLTLVNAYHEEETGASMVCFVDKNGQAYVVFAGTGANEWRDDCVAGAMADSPQQVKALQWFESLPYDDIVVSGHSKGGNKAMYVMVTSDKAKECYAFDGEGFSNEFLEKYGEEINKKASNIHLRAHYRDFVNVLLNCIAGDVKFVINEEGIGHVGEYHCPNALFEHENGRATYQIGELADFQDPAMEMLHEFTLYLINEASEAEKILALSVLGELCTLFLGGEDGVVRKDILATYGKEGLEVIFQYYTKYLQDLKRSDPQKYQRYEAAWKDFIGDGTGSGFWGGLLGNLVMEPLVGYGIIDFINQFTALETKGRDFSQKALEQMINAVKETEEEAWWRIDRWDCWYRVQQVCGGIRWERYTGRVDEYYRKLIDINDASVKDIQDIFSRVYEIDTSYGKKMEQITSNLTDHVVTPLKNIAASIVPSST